MINLLVLTLLCVFVIDCSGVIDELEASLAKWLRVKSVRIPKPFSCSLCTSWWLGLVYLIVTQHFTLLWVGYVALLAFLTPVFYNALTLLRDLLNKLLGLVSSFFKLG